jgi:hypothetical protein
MDPGLQLLASRWFLTPFAILSTVGTIAFTYILIAGVELQPSNILRIGVMLLLSYMGTALSLEARRAVA